MVRAGSEGRGRPCGLVVSHSGPCPPAPGQPGQEGGGLWAPLTHLHTLAEPRQSTADIANAPRVQQDPDQVGRQGWGLPGLPSLLPWSCSGTLEGAQPRSPQPHAQGARSPPPPSTQCTELWVSWAPCSAWEADLSGVPNPVAPRSARWREAPERRPAGGGLGGWPSQAETRSQRPYAWGQFPPGRHCLGSASLGLCSALPRPVRGGLPARPQCRVGACSKTWPKW